MGGRRGGEAGRHKSFHKVGVATAVDAVRGARARMPGVDVFVPATGEENEWTGGGVGGEGEACCGSCRATIGRGDFIVLQEMKRASAYFVSVQMCKGFMGLNGDALGLLKREGVAVLTYIQHNPASCACAFGDVDGA